MTSVSIVMGVYNGGESIEPSIASILSQEGVDLELVVVDDGSTDDGWKRLAHIAARDSRMRVIRQDNQGLTAALIVKSSIMVQPSIGTERSGPVPAEMSMLVS